VGKNNIIKQIQPKNNQIRECSLISDKKLRGIMKINIENLIIG